MYCTHSLLYERGGGVIGVKDGRTDTLIKGEEEKCIIIWWRFEIFPFFSFNIWFPHINPISFYECLLLLVHSRNNHPIRTYKYINPLSLSLSTLSFFFLYLSLHSLFIFFLYLALFHLSFSRSLSLFEAIIINIEY